MADKTIEADTKNVADTLTSLYRPCIHTHELRFGYKNKIYIVCYIMIVGLYSHIS